MAADKGASGTETSIRRVLLLAVIGAALIGWLLLLLALPGWLSPEPFQHSVLFSDLVVYRNAGSAVLHGQFLYSEAGIVAGDGQRLPWTYPPFGALVMVPASALSLPWAQTSWTAASLIALTGVVAVSFATLTRGLRRRWIGVGVLSVLALPLTPVVDCLGLGQVGILLTLACLLDAVVLAGREARWTGVLVGFATSIKLTPAIFIGYWLVTGQWRSARNAVLTVLLCWSVAGALVWSSSWAYFAGLRFAEVNNAIGRWSSSRFNQSLHGLVERHFENSTPVWIVLVAVVLVAGGAIARQAYAQGDLLAGAAAVGLVGLLCSPVSWHHHAIWILPAIGAVLGNGSRVWRLGAAILFMIVGYYPARGYQLPGTEEMWVVLYLVLLGALALAVKEPADTNSHAGTRHPATGQS